MTTLQKVSRDNQKEEVFLVIVDGREVGLLTKYKNTRTETHPWKAWRGVGKQSQYAGAFYGRTGKRDALNVVLGK